MGQIAYAILITYDDDQKLDALLPANYHNSGPGESLNIDVGVSLDFANTGPVIVKIFNQAGELITHRRFDSSDESFSRNGIEVVTAEVSPG